MSHLIAVGTDNGAVVLKPGADRTEWKLASHALHGRRIVALLFLPGGGLYAGAANGAVYHTTDGETWRSLVEGLTGDGVWSITAHAAKPDVLFAGSQPASVFKSTDRGETWRACSTFMQVKGASSWTLPRPPYRPIVRSLAHHPHEPDALFAGVHVGGMLASLDGGRTWMERHGGLGREINELEIHRAAPARIYAATGAGFYRSDDLGGGWTLHSTGLPYTSADDMALDPDDPDKLMVAVSKPVSHDGGAVCRSADGGRTWQPCVTGLPALTNQTVTSLEAGGGEVYAVTDKGELWSSNNFGGLWIKVRTGMPPARVVAVVG